MGEMAEYYEHVYFGDDEQDWPLHPYEWMTNDGNVLDMRDMSTMHIINCIDMLKHKFPESPSLPYLEEVLEYREKNNN